MLAGVAAIEAAVVAMAAVIDGFDHDRAPADGGADTDRS
jgi:hypothetical protein